MTGASVDEDGIVRGTGLLLEVAASLDGVASRLSAGDAGLVWIGGRRRVHDQVVRDVRAAIDQLLAVIAEEVVDARHALARARAIDERRAAALRPTARR